MGRTHQQVSIFATLLLCACSKAEPPVLADSDAAVAALKAEVAKDSTNWTPHLKLATELRHKKRLEEAAQEAAKAFELQPAPAIESRFEMAKAHAAADRSASAINIVKDAEKKKMAGEITIDEVDIAEVYAVIGDPSAVFRWLERAITSKSAKLATLETNPDLVSVHDDPRWAGIVERAKQGA
jgi:hypothetical protein